LRDGWKRCNARAGIERLRKAKSNSDRLTRGPLPDRLRRLNAAVGRDGQGGPRWYGRRVSRELRLPIETERLRLRRLVGGDLAALYALHSREDVTSWLFWGPREQGEVRVSLDGHIARPLDEGSCWRSIWAAS
jgi:RimJ/RimL family protein N-acetyltransferase